MPSKLDTLMGLGFRSYSNGAEFAVPLDGGAVFFTSGFEDVESLHQSINARRPIFGTFSPNSGDWCDTTLSATKIVAIIDLRTAGDGR